MLVGTEQEYKIHNADILFKEDCTVDDLIDIIEVGYRIPGALREFGPLYSSPLLCNIF